MKPRFVGASAKSSTAFLFKLGALVACVPSVAGHPGSGIAVDQHGRVFFAAGPMIVMIETNGNARTIVHDTRHEKFYQLHHFHRAPDGGWLTASDRGDAIWSFGADGKLVRFYPPPNQDRPLRVGSGGDPFTVDRVGNVYAVNSIQDRFTQILRVTVEGRVEFVAGGDWGFADGTGASARFSDLHGGSMVMAPDGALVITDGLARIRRVTTDGTVTTIAGGAERGHAEGPGSVARFDGASGLAFDPLGNLFVAEQSGRIRRITPDGVVNTFAGSGRRGRTDGPPLEATFEDPTGIAIGPDGDVFVLEPSRPRVRRISATRVSTVHSGLP